MATIPWNITPGGPFNFFGMTMVVCEINTKNIGGGDSAGNIILPKNFVPESILPFIGGTASIAHLLKATVSGSESDVTVVDSAPTTSFTGYKAVESNGSYTIYKWDATANSNAGGAVEVTADSVRKVWEITPNLSSAEGIVKIRVLGHY